MFVTEANDFRCVSEAVFSFVDDTKILSALFVEILMPAVYIALMRGWVLNVERGPRRLLPRRTRINSDVNGATDTALAP